MKKKYRKYSNKKVEVDGHKFDSKKEANRYLELKLQQKTGYISNLELQPEFILQDSFKSGGKAYRAIKYIADFRYIKNGDVIIEDVKGMKTEKYLIKKKLFLKKYQELKFIET